MSPDVTDKEIHFKNYLSLRENPWLGDHQVQGQIVFPAAGYISSVVEAVAYLYEIDSVHLVEMTDIIIGHALLIPHDDKVETLLSLKVNKDVPEYRELLFTFCSDGSKGSSVLTENASGTIRVIHGSPSEDSLPRPHIPDSGFTEVESDKFYSTTRELGFEYEGFFRGLSRTARKANEATGLLAIPKPDLEDDKGLIIHPGILDCAIQCLIIAYSYPKDGRLRTLHLPTRVDKLHINIRACRNFTRVPGAKLPVYASIDLSQPVDFVGDIQIHSPTNDFTIVQVQGLHVPPLTPHSPESDVNMFTEMMWGPELPSGKSLAKGGDSFSDDYAVSFLLERVAYYYLRRIGTALPQHARGKLERHQSHFLDYVDHCLAWVEMGTHPYVKKRWSDDSEDDILRIFKQ
jgi:hybrid polyketide synthase/nonribosomal peptide synthetase ACE1